MNIKYDALRRPLEQKLTESSATKTLEVYEYGEGQTDDKAHNLRGKVYKVYDGAGVVAMPDYDFKGNVLTQLRTYTLDATQRPDWTNITAVAMETGDYETGTLYNALNRPLQLTTPDTGKTKYTYDRGGMLYSVAVEGVHSLDSAIVNKVEYDAKGQRQKIQYQNGATSTYGYDTFTFRVRNIKTTRASDGKVLQDLQYWYDPVGNITLQKDGALQPVYFNGTVADPENDYTYDALYRLIQAEGRELAGNNNAPTYNDSGRMGITPIPIAATDTAKMRRYIQYYEYDAVGNFIQMRHTVTGGTGNWSRNYTTDNNSNKLMSTVVGSGTPESYAYDNRGNIVSGFSHLQSMSYNAENRLEQVAITGTRTAYYQYDANGQRVRKTITDTSSNTTEIRKYIGEWEVYSKLAGSSLNIERETLHISDDTGRIALIDTRTQGTGAEPPQLLRYQYSNHLQSAALELDYAGDIISYEEYYPYGSTSFQSGRSLAEVSLKRYRYCAAERDEENGFYYFGARYYAPWLCRWLACDPINSENYNLGKGYGLQKNKERDFLELCASSYEYCYDNPIRFTDPSGEQVPWKQIGGELGTIPQESVEGVKSFQNSVRKTVAKVAEAATQPLTRMAGKSAIFKINSELQDTNVDVNGYQVSKVIGGTTTQKTNSIKTDTDLPSANKFNLYVNTNTMFHISESNAKKFVNYELGVVAALMNNFVTGLGPENYSFPENGIISNKFIENKSKVLKDALTQFLKIPTKNITNEQFEFGGEGLKQDFNQTGTLFSITGLVGSASITITNDAKRGGVAISIFNITSLTSGAIGKEFGPESAWPQSYMRDGKSRVSYGNISQTFSLFIPYGKTEATKYSNVQNVLNQMNTTK